MRASSPALALVTRPLAVPRPRPRAVPDASPEREESSGVVPAPLPDVGPRPTLRSIDLEYLGDVEPPRRSSVPPPLPARARERAKAAIAPRMSQPEMAAAVLASLRDLTFFERPIEAMAFGVVTAMQLLPSLGGLAMLRDETGAYAVVYARGPHAYEVVRARIPEDDPIVGLSLVRGGPVSVEYGSDTPPTPRHAVFGDPWSAIVTPILQGDRCVGVLELVDPLEGPLGDSARLALDAIAQHTSLFLRGRAVDVHAAFAPEQVGLVD